MNQIAKWLWFLTFAVLAFGLWAFIIIPVAVIGGVVFKIYYDDYKHKKNETELDKSKN